MSEFTFQFDISASLWDSSANKIPIVNTGTSFSFSPITYSLAAGVYSVTIAGTYTEKGSTVDGLQFCQAVNGTNYSQSAGIKITQFGGMPLCRNSGQSYTSGIFANFGGKITATDVPTILTNTSFSGAFYASNVISINFGNIGSWNTTNVINMSSMFSSATNFNQNIGSWNTANVTNMGSLFQNATNFNQNIGSWNTANVTDMGLMFFNASAFNQNISSWNTANVTTMSFMFYTATNFNQNIGSWNTANVRSMNSMFFSATNFNNGDSGNSMVNPIYWNTSNVSNMTSMFNAATKFNQHIGHWDTRNVTSANALNMFVNATAFTNASGTNQPQSIKTDGTIYTYSQLQGWGYTTELSPAAPNTFTIIPINIRAIVSFNQYYPAFYSLSKYQYTTDNSNWYDCSGTYSPIVINGLQNGTLYNTMQLRSVDSSNNYSQSSASLPSFTPIVTSSIANVGTSKSFIFKVLKSQWDLSGGILPIINTNASFQNLTTSVSSVDASLNVTVTISWSAFNDNGTTKDGLQFRRSGSATYLSHSSIEIITFGGVPLSRNTGEAFANGIFASFAGKISAATNDCPTILTDTSFLGAFSSCSMQNVNFGNISNWETTNVINMSYMFNGATNFNQYIGDWNTANVTNMSYMFQNANIFNQYIGLWNTSKVTNVSFMFNVAPRFNQNIGSWNTANVTLMNNMFTSATNFNQDIGLWNTAKVTNMSYMFYATNFNQNIGSWNTGNVTDMQSMLSNASFNQNIGSWNTANVTNMNSMFSSSPNFNKDIGSWNTANVTNMTSIFQQATNFNQNIGSWNTANVTNMQSMFQSATNFNQNIGSWNTGNVNNMQTMFYLTSLFNHNIGSWNTANVTNMSSMFQSASNFNNGDSGNSMANPMYWNTANVTKMTQMFSSAIKFNQHIGHWDTRNVNAANVSNMFANTTAFTNASGTNQPQSIKTDGTIYTYLQLQGWGYTTELSPTAPNTFTIIPSNLRAVVSINQYYPAFYSLSKYQYTNNNSNWYDCSGRYSPIIINGLQNGTLYNTIQLRSVDASNNYSQSSAILPSFTPIATSSIANVGTSKSFIFKVLKSQWDLSGGILPIINTNASFQNLTTSVSAVDAILNVTVTISWSAFNDNGTTKDGLQFRRSGSATYLSHSSIEIIAFGGVPLSRNTGEAFANGIFASFAGKISAAPNDCPTILTNTLFLGAFYNCSIPNLNFGNILNWETTNVINMSYMFSSATNFNQYIGEWNTSNVTNMSNMFNGATNFNQYIGLWNTVNVTNMSLMFQGATAFNQNIGLWNTANVTLMNQMFYAVTYFNQDISLWNTVNVTNMGSMFANATNFNQNIGSWNTANVTSMNYMFNSATNFNQNIGLWNTTKVNNMTSMFQSATNFNQNIGSWNTVNATIMSSMFLSATNFNQNIGSWNTAKVTNMSFMFNSATNFNANIGSWNTANVTNMQGMFQSASAFNQNIGSWNTANVTNMQGMFQGASAFNQNIGSWNTANALAMNQMFSTATNFNNGESTNLAANPMYWNTRKVTDMTSMFVSATKFNQHIGAWDTRKVTAANSLTMFSDATAFNAAVTATTNLPGIIKTDGTIYTYSTLTGYSTLTTPYSQTELMGYSIVDLSANKFVFDITQATWNSSVKTPIINDNGSFVGLTYSIATSIYNAAKYTVTATWTSFTDNGTTLDGLQFRQNGAAYLSDSSIEIIAFGGVPLSRNTGQANTNGIFYSFAGKISAIDAPLILPNTTLFGAFKDTTVASVNFGNIGAWTTINVTNMSEMFSGATNFNQNIGLWNTGNVTLMGSLFANANNFNNGDSGNSMANPMYWNTRNVTNIISMFNGAIKFNQRIGHWDTRKVTAANALDMFTGATAFANASATNQPQSIKTDGTKYTQSQLITWGYTTDFFDKLPTGFLQIVGNSVNGSILSLNNAIADADGLPSVFTYQWYANTVAISGATNATYTLTLNENNKIIYCIVNYIDAKGFDESFISNNFYCLYDWLTISNNYSNRFKSCYNSGFVDISGGGIIVRNNNLLVDGDASFNSNVSVNNLGVGATNLNYKANIVGNSYFTNNVFIGSDMSLNAGKLFVSGNVNISGKLSASNYISSSIPISAFNGSIPINYSNDISMQKRLFVSSGDISFNNIPTVATDFNVNNAAMSLNSKNIVPGSITIVDNSVNNIYGSYINFANSAGTTYYNMGKSKSNLFNIVNQNNIGVYLQAAATTFTSTSDIRLKKNIKPIETVLDKIINIKPCYYNWKNQIYDSPNVGFIAQELEKIFPNIVSEIGSEPEQLFRGVDDSVALQPLKGINIIDIVPYLVKALQERQIILNKLQINIESNA